MIQNQLAMALNLLLAGLARKPMPRTISMGHVTGYALNGIVRITNAKLGNVYATLETTEKGTSLTLTNAPLQRVFPAAAEPLESKPLEEQSGPPSHERKALKGKP